MPANGGGCKTGKATVQARVAGTRQDGESRDLFLQSPPTPLAEPRLAKPTSSHAGAVTCSVKCRPHHRLSTPQLPAALELLPRGAPAFANELQATRCRTPPSLSFARASDQGGALPCPCRSPPSARQARAAVAGREEAGPAAPMAAAAVLTGAQSRHAIFREELVRRAYYTADEAHRGHSSQPAATAPAGATRLLAARAVSARAIAAQPAVLLGTLRISAACDV
ncbi:hypothetical protein D1007_25685 [Hordeum vulgare]|nr:hypothetical protein D1007_25685 [Hordeum vulgare]